MFLNEAGPLLAQGHGLRVLAPDAPGFGLSPPAEAERYEPEALAGLISLLAGALELERFAFLGFSWGGDVGCHFAARSPELLAALVLLDAGYCDPPVDPALSHDELLEQNERRFELMCAPSWEPLAVELKKRHRRWSAAVEESYRVGWKEEGGRLVPLTSPCVVAAIEYAMARAPASTVLERVGESGVPVLLVVPPGAAEEDLARFTADVPQAEVMRLESGGHDVFVDGGPNVVHAVGRWLEARA
jgi:pimeloyl-ACP methyl ester carboxylesterase